MILRCLNAMGESFFNWVEANVPAILFVVFLVWLSGLALAIGVLLWAGS